MSEKSPIQTETQNGDRGPFDILFASRVSIALWAVIITAIVLAVKNW